MLALDMYVGYVGALVVTGFYGPGVMEVANLKGLYRVFERC